MNCGKPVCKLSSPRQAQKPALGMRDHLSKIILVAEAILLSISISIESKVQIYPYWAMLEAHPVLSMLIGSGRHNLTAFLQLDVTVRFDLPLKERRSKFNRLDTTKTGSVRTHPAYLER